MKKSIYILIIIFLLILFVIFNVNDITNLSAKIFNTTPKVYVPVKNSYSLDKNYDYVKKTDNFVPHSRQDLLNILYTVFDNGYTNFTFYCPNEYKSCREDIEDIGSNQTLITNIGNFVHPFNNFTNLKISTNSFGKVDIKVKKMYTESQINFVNKVVEDYLNTLDKNMTLDNKLLKIHDYLIEKTNYDMENTNEYGNAYDLFSKGKTRCSGYSDAFAVFLNKLGVQNIKVASDDHVWNALYINNKWIHVDLTWDDPISKDTVITDFMRHKFYMIDTKTLLAYDTEDHYFDTDVYEELK